MYKDKVAQRDGLDNPDSYVIAHVHLSDPPSQFAIEIGAYPAISSREIEINGQGYTVTGREIVTGHGEPAENYKLIKINS